MWSLFDVIFNVVEVLVCYLYGKKGQNVDLLRYELYCVKGGKVDLEVLLLCRMLLCFYMKCVNY